MEYSKLPPLEGTVEVEETLDVWLSLLSATSTGTLSFYEEDDHRLNRFLIRFLS